MTRQPRRRAKRATDREVGVVAAVPATNDHPVTMRLAEPPGGQPGGSGRLPD
jgi:hypothetical protein